MRVGPSAHGGEIILLSIVLYYFSPLTKATTKESNQILVPCIQDLSVRSENLSYIGLFFNN